MARISLVERLAKLAAQKRQLEEQQRALRARVSHDRKKRETRQLILLGAFLLHQLQRSGASMKPIRAWVARELPAFLTKPRDREVMADILSALQAGRDLPMGEADRAGDQDPAVAATAA